MILRPDQSVNNLTVAVLSAAIYPALPTEDLTNTPSALAPE